MNKKIDMFIGFLVTVIWGANFVIIEVGLHDLDPFMLTFLRFFLCAFPLVFFIKKPENVSFFYLTTYGLFFGVGLWWIVNYAMYQGLSAGLASIFLQFSAFFTILLSFLILHEKMTKIHIIGMLLSGSGLLMIIYFSDEHSTVTGILFVLLAAISWAICNMIIKKTKPANMVAFIVWSSLFSAPAILILTIIVNGWNGVSSVINNMTISAAGSVIFQAYVTTILGYKIWNNLIKKYPAAEVAPLSLFVPISGILSSYFFLGERLTDWQWLSIGAVIMGIFIFLNSSRYSKIHKKK